MATESDNDRRPPAESFGAKLSTNTSIWYRLIIPGVDNEGSEGKIKGIDNIKDIADLRDEIKNKNPDLKDTPARKLEVYPPGTKFDDIWNPKYGHSAYEPWNNVPQVKFIGNVPQPLIVVAPKVVYDSSHQVSFVFLDKL